MPVRSKKRATTERRKVKAKVTPEMTESTARSRKGAVAKKRRQAKKSIARTGQRQDRRRAKALIAMTENEKADFKRVRRGYQEALREKLAGQGHERKITAILNELFHMQRAVRDMGVVFDEESQTIYTDEATMRKILARERLLRTKLDAHMKLLNKYLPDLRSVEVNADAGEDDNKVNTVEAMMAAWSESLFGETPRDEDEYH